jgi:hypothetical protein
MKKCLRIFVMLFASLPLAAAIANAPTAHADQGKYITSASARLTKLIDLSNAVGYKLQNDSFSIGGGWLKQSASNWVNLYTITLTKGRDYRFLAAGDQDSKDVDLQILDETGTVVASDTAVSNEAIVGFRPTVTARYTVRLRLYASRDNVPCVCLGIMLAK